MRYRENLWGDHLSYYACLWKVSLAFGSSDNMVLSRSGWRHLSLTTKGIRDRLSQGERERSSSSQRRYPRNLCGPRRDRNTQREILEKDKVKKYTRIRNWAHWLLTGPIFSFTNPGSLLPPLFSPREFPRKFLSQHKVAAFPIDGRRHLWHQKRHIKRAAEDISPNAYKLRAECVWERGSKGCALRPGRGNR